jgi:hypothetical protein
MLSFSVAGAAAVFMLCVVGLLCAAKLLCVVTGCERRLPDIDFEVLYEEQKAMLETLASGPRGSLAAGSGETLLGVIQTQEGEGKGRRQSGLQRVGSLLRTGSLTVETASIPEEAEAGRCDKY